MSGPSIAVERRDVPGADEILTPEALDFVADLHRQFNHQRIALLEARHERQKELDAGIQPDFPAATADVRAAEWTVAPAPPDLDDRRVEITGPAEPKMMINALNSGARVFMADLEDALSPTWANVVGGQAALKAAVRRELAFDSPEGKAYRLNDGDRDPARPAARLASRRAARARRRRADLGQPVRLRAVLLPQRRRGYSRAAAAPTSTCPSSRAATRPGSGTRSSSTPSRRSASRGAASGRRS